MFARHSLSRRQKWNEIVVFVAVFASNAGELISCESVAFCQPIAVVVLLTGSKLGYGEIVVCRPNILVVKVHTTRGRHFH